MSIYWTIDCQLSPTAAPMKTSAVFQMRLPIVVSKTNSRKFIFDMPAGIEIRLRISGTSRQNNTVQGPYLSNHASARWMSFRVRRKIPPHRSTIFSSFDTSISNPMLYKTIAPMTEPAVAAIITPIFVKSVYVVINPPNVKITSEGIGGNTFSIMINSNTPK